MKAKEYYNVFKKENLDDSIDVRIIKILNMFVLEFETIQKKRNAITNVACRAIFKELNDKCNAFIKIANEKDNLGIVNDALKIYIEARTPSLYKLAF